MLLRLLVTPLAAAILLAGCGGKNAGDDPVPITSLGEGSPTATAGTPTEAAPAPTQQAPGFPDDAQEYAQAVIAAWAAADLDRLGDLTSALVQDQMISIPGPPNMFWTLIRCDGAAGSTYCTFFNEDGDEVRLRVTNQKLGGPHAVTEVVYQVTPFPDDGVEYVEVLVRAWLDGNTPRMKLLARQDAMDYLAGSEKPSRKYVLGSQSGGGGLQFVTVSDGPGYSPRTLQVGTTLLGGPQAVLDEG